MVDNVWNERYQVVLALGIFAVPAVIHAAGRLFEPPLLGLLFVVGGPFLYLRWTSSEGSGARTRGLEREFNGEDDDTVRGASTGDPEVELVATNYEQMSSQAEYRDHLLVHANYFSLAIIAILVNVFQRADNELRPLIAMVGAATAYAFWLATESYKGARDELNDELRYIEDYRHEELSVVRTWDRRERTLIGNRSLSSYFIGVQIVATILWWAVYGAYVLYLGRL